MPAKYTLLPLSKDSGRSRNALGRSDATKRSAARLKIFALLITACLFYGAFRLGFAARLPPFFGEDIQCSGENQTIDGLPSHYTLPSGDKIPSVALGVWRAAKNEVGRAVKTALCNGYRHIDGAWIYRNEEEVGRALKESDIPREEVWITSKVTIHSIRQNPLAYKSIKLWNTFHAPDDIEPVLDESLRRLGTDYLDLYLIHWPVAMNDDGSYDKDLTEDPYPTWQKLEELVDKGKLRNIGVSNFNERRIKNLTANPLKYKPAVNQVELSFWLPQPELVQWSRENDILLEAYSPLGSSERVRDSLNVPEVKEIAAQTGLTAAQVLISWHVQRGTIVLPKSVTPSRVRENLHVVRLPDDAFEKLEQAATSHKPSRGSNPSKNWGLDFDIFD
ncbi:hypothetical protein V5O48_004866 [Marasmius crinis-equi]|uniref:NADP-dependent oxidoreductase domain-containing protein n=1 Tax=Marasmius crinis-equi TaxID=585013 RepID=A0ABR3FP43_9AGAR